MGECSSAEDTEEIRGGALRKWKTGGCVRCGGGVYHRGCREIESHSHHTPSPTQLPVLRTFRPPNFTYSTSRSLELSYFQISLISTPPITLRPNPPASLRIFSAHLCVPLRALCATTLPHPLNLRTFRLHFSNPHRSNIIFLRLFSKIRKEFIKVKRIPGNDMTRRDISFCKRF